MSERAIFLDRDETLIKDPGYISNPDQVELLDGVPEALNTLRDLRYKLIVVSNQSGVARGIVTEKVLGQIHDRLKQLLAEKDAHLDRIYYCPYHPDGVVPKYRKESNNRKPNPGMLLTAAKDMDIDLEQSWCIGNSIRDIEAGKRAGCKTILIDAHSQHKQTDSRTRQSDIKPDYKGVNLREAVNIIKKHLRSSAKTQTQAQTNPVVPDEPSENVTETADNEAEPASETKESVTEISESPSEEEETSSEATEPEQMITEANSGTDVREPQREQKRMRISPEEKDTANSRTEQLLVDILGQLRNMQRAEMFSEFSIMRLIAGIVQILVLFCLLISIWFLMSPESRPNSVFIALGFAIVFQLMSLTFYIMHSRK